MRVLLHGAGFVNKGAEAMLLTVKRQLQQRLGDVSFCVLERSVSPDTEGRHRAEQIELVYEKPTAWSRLRYLAEGVIRRPIGLARDSRSMYHFAPLASAIESVDAIIDISGYAYGAPWGPSRAAITNILLDAATSRRKPYIFLPQAWGPFDQPHRRAQYRRVAGRGTMLFARDRQSRAYLSGLLSTQSAEIEVAPDVAFRFDSADVKVGQTILNELGFSIGSDQVVGIAPNRKVYERTCGSGLENEYVRALIDISRQIAESGYGVVLIPHEIQAASTGAFDDRILCALVAAEARHPRVRALAGQPTAAELKSVISQLACLIGSRFHTLVAALSSRVPVMALGWSHKYVELLEEFGCGEFVLDHTELQSADLGRRFATLMTKRDMIREKLAHELVRIESAVDTTFDKVANTLTRAA
ncbi:MAG: polysaccharide pyruvyl transferase family protein [Planctomycetaceae bacterium]